jgi:hypothetical protein
VETGARHETGLQRVSKWRDPVCAVLSQMNWPISGTLAQFEGGTVDLSDVRLFSARLQPEMTTSALGEQFSRSGLCD